MARHGHHHHHRPQPHHHHHPRPHHHHHPRPHHHRAHHHHHNRGNIGAYPGGVNNVGGYCCCSVVLTCFGAFCLLSGTIMMATGFGNFGSGSGIAGTILFAVGAGLVTTSCVLCYCARKGRRKSTVVNQQVAGGTTLGYGQPGGTQAIVQPPPPPGAVAYGPGGVPIASQAAPPGVTIVYGPGAGQPPTQAGFQHQPQQYPNQPYQATAPYPPAQAGVPYPLQPDVPYPPQPVSEPAGKPDLPPPSYDEAVKSQAVAVDIDGPTT